MVFPIRQPSWDDMAITPINEEYVEIRVIINRQSSPNNRKKDADKIVAIMELGRRPDTSDAETIYRRFVGSGRLDILLERHFFDAVDSIAALPKYGVFAKMLRFFESLLRKRPGEKWRIEVFSWDRIFRPLGFNHRKMKETGTIIDDDKQFFDKMLHWVFGSDADNLVFVAHHEGSWEHIHRLQSEIGRKNGVGGRPKKPTVNRKQAQSIAVELAVEGFYAPEILTRLLDEYDFDVPKSTMKRWLKKKNVQKSPGRPRGSRKKGSFSKLNVPAVFAKIPEITGPNPLETLSTTPKETVCIFSPLRSHDPTSRIELNIDSEPESVSAPEPTEWIGEL